MPKGMGYPAGHKKDKKKQKRVTNMGRILEGPRGGQFTPRKARKEEY